MIITIDLIKSYNPCQGGIEKFEKDHPNYEDELSSLLRLADVSYSDKLWLVTKVVDYRILQVWSVMCAESVADNYNNEYPDDTRINDCIQKTKDYLDGNCSEEDLSAAGSAALSAALSASESAESATESAESAVESAAWSAGSVAVSAARSAARSARSAESVTRSAVWSAAESAIWSARSVVWSARNEQEEINLKLLLELL